MRQLKKHTILNNQKKLKLKPFSEIEIIKCIEKFSLAELIETIFITSELSLFRSTFSIKFIPLESIHAMLPSIPTNINSLFSSLLEEIQLNFPKF